MSVLRWIRRWWWSRQRAIDMAILWPICKQEAPNLDYAKAAFAVHAYNDEAWIGEYGDSLYEVISGLE